MVNFSSLPEDVTSIIITSYLSHKDKCALRLTSKRYVIKFLDITFFAFSILI